MGILYLEKLDSELEVFWGLNKFQKTLLFILKSYQSFNFSRKICADLTVELA